MKKRVIKFLFIFFTVLVIDSLLIVVENNEIHLLDYDHQQFIKDIESEVNEFLDCYLDDTQRNRHVCIVQTQNRFNQRFDGQINDRSLRLNFDNVSRALHGINSAPASDSDYAFLWSSLNQLIESQDLRLNLSLAQFRQYQNNLDRSHVYLTLVNRTSGWASWSEEDDYGEETFFRRYLFVNRSEVKARNVIIQAIIYTEGNSEIYKVESFEFENFDVSENIELVIRHTIPISHVRFEYQFEL